MKEEKMMLPSMERVKVVGGLYPKLMEIADPPQSLFDKLTKEELTRVFDVNIKYQNRLIEIEMTALKAQSDALVEIQKVVKGFK